MPTYTNRQRRNNLLREMCHRFVRETLPTAYDTFRKEAERKYRNQRPDITKDGYQDLRHAARRRA